MWIGDYQRARDLVNAHNPVDALLAAAYIRGDAHHKMALEHGFPDLVLEVRQRFDAPGGCLTMEEYVSCHGEPPAHDRAYLENRFAELQA